ncbi:hypothetical protein BDN71DRAFT_1435466 [Pleurotus eryngii]|uniref:Uncharacterized protein n=1 Tax=Pleurotus eryngii TaxID=5323 RepID=A0A9P5ZL73_PLEER|nr:hypothetical protein BDN71DRAFT_1435466 [Pleurotus eryngii]
MQRQNHSSTPHHLAQPPEPCLHLGPPPPHPKNIPSINAALARSHAAQTCLPTISGAVPHNNPVPSTSQPVEPQSTHHRTVPTSAMGPSNARTSFPTHLLPYQLQINASHSLGLQQLVQGLEMAIFQHCITTVSGEQQEGYISWAGNGFRKEGKHGNM